MQNFYVVKFRWLQILLFHGIIEKIVDKYKLTIFANYYKFQ